MTMAGARMMYLLNRLLFIYYGLFLMFEIACCSNKVLHFKSYPPFLLNGDLYGYRAAIDLGLRFLRDNETILPGYNLTVHYKDSERNAGIAASDMLTTINEGKYPIQYTFGPYHPFENNLVGYVAQQYSIPMNLERKPSDQIFFLSTVKLLKHFNWRRIAIVQLLPFDGNVGQDIDGLRYMFENAGIEVPLSQKFAPTFIALNSEISTREIKQFFDQIEENDIRVINIMNMKHADFISFFCYAFTRNMTSPKYQYITADTNGLNTIRTTFPNANFPLCFPEGLTAANNLIRVVPKAVREKESITSYGGKTVQDIYDLVDQTHLKAYEKHVKSFKEMFNTTPPISRRLKIGLSLHVVDQVYQVGLAYHKLLFDANKTEEDVLFKTTYNNKEKFLQIQEAILDVHFDGVSGIYTPRNNREGSQYDISIEIFNRRFGFVDMGSYNIHTDILNIKTTKQIGVQNTRIEDLPKRDRRLDIVELEVYKGSVLYTVWSICIVSLVLVVVLFFLNNRYKDIKALKMTSPDINNMMMVGAALCYTSILLYGIDGKHIVVGNIKYMCTMSTSMLTIGYTFVYGSLFGKTWRVYKIFTASRYNKTMKLKDYHIVGFVTLLLVLDVGVLVTWFVVSPYQLQNKFLNDKTFPEEDKTVTTIFHRCDCKYRVHFIVVVIIEKTILLILGLFLAWETRNVNIPILNDARYLGASIYTVAMAAVAGTISTMTLHHKGMYNEEYLVLGVAVCVAITTTLCLALVPKFLVMFGKNTMERRRTLSTSSMDYKNATENILHAHRIRVDKLKSLRNHQPAVENQPAVEQQKTNGKAHNNDAFKIESTRALPPYQQNDPSLPGPSGIATKIRYR